MAVNYTPIRKTQKGCSRRIWRDCKQVGSGKAAVGRGAAAVRDGQKDVLAQIAGIQAYSIARRHNENSPKKCTFWDSK